MEKDFSHPNLHFWEDTEFVYYRVGTERKFYQLTKKQASEFWLDEKDRSPKNGCNDVAGWLKYQKSMQERAWNVCTNRPGKVMS